MKAAKVIHPTFNLSTVMGRTVFLTGVALGSIPTTYIQAVVKEDNYHRPYRKPVVAGGRRYSSIRAAAVSILRVAGSGVNLDYAKQLNALEKRIARLCNADNVEGFYWSE